MQNEKNKGKTALKGKRSSRDSYLEEIIAQTENDFEERRQERVLLERQWELNVNFLSGNQYCDLSAKGEILDEDKQFFWQTHRVYNHVAPVVETRLAKFARIKPTIFVRPQTDDDKAIERADTAERFINGVFDRVGVESVVSKVNSWSEACGTGFYKIVWDNLAGATLGQLDGKKVSEGDVKIIPVSPFEIFPDNLYAENLEDCLSIIHARAMPVKVVKEKYGVAIAGEDIGVFNLNKVGKATFNQDTAKATIKDSVIVIEKYEKPSSEYPNGRLITVAGGKLLYYGELPYKNGVNGQRTYPFVKQESITQAGSFFGSSIIERLIPVQRAFNAVKNRKHEFLNRLSMGIMTVEDGSIDTDELAEEGLKPGKVLVYRQGSKAPQIMDETTMPAEFSDEEQKLLNEFVTISGVPDVTSAANNVNVKSGVALELLVEQDNERLTPSAENIRKSFLELSRHIIRLYTQFTSGVRILRFQDEFGKTKVIYADKEHFSSDDVYLDGENEMLYSPSQRKDVIMRLYDSGLLADEDGRIRPAVREKLLMLLGYKDLDYSKGLSRLQEERAQEENEVIKKEGKEVEEIDDHQIHLDEHTRYVLCEYKSLTSEQKERLLAHVKAHKDKLNQKGE